MHDWLWARRGWDAQEYHDFLLHLLDRVCVQITEVGNDGETREVTYIWKSEREVNFDPYFLELSTATEDGEEDAPPEEDAPIEEDALPEEDAPIEEDAPPPKKFNLQARTWAVAKFNLQARRSTLGRLKEGSSSSLPPFRPPIPSPPSPLHLP